MTKEEVLERLCRLASQVNAARFCYFAASDCFCPGAHEMPDGYRFDDAVLEYIEEAVRRQLDIDLRPEEAL